MSSARIHAYIALLAVSAIWGIAGPVIKATLEHIPPMTFLLFRFMLIAPVTIPWYWWYLKKHPVRPADFLSLTLLGFLVSTLHLSFIFLGFERTSALEGTLIAATHPLFIVLAGYFFLREKITRKEKIGISFIMTGGIITTVEPLIRGNGIALQHTLGNIFIIISGISLAIFVVYSKRNFDHITPLHITLHGSIVALVSYIPLAMFENAGRFPSLMTLFDQPASLAGVLYLSYLSYLAAYALFEYGIREIEISEASLFQYLSPIFAMPFAIAWLGESITAGFIISVFFITAGIVLSEWR